MNKNLIAIFLSLVFISSTTMAIQKNEIRIDPEQVHVPSGFDANDNVEIIVTGIQPPCYKKPSAKVKINGSQIYINLTAQPMNDDDFCIQSFKRYMTTVSIGRLATGRYDILINPFGAKKHSSEIIIDKPASDSVDNFTYANVLSVEKMPGLKTIVLKGAHNTSCMKLTKVSILPNENFDTFVVLPIVEKVDAQCDHKLVWFTHHIPLPTFEEKNVVFHVRKTNGMALNLRL